MTFVDVMQRTQADGMAWLPFGDDAGLLRLRVEAGVVEKIKG